MDISKAQFFSDKHLDFLKDNMKAIMQEDLIKQLRKGEDQKAIKRHHKNVSI